jgi:hypothetical protein
MAFNPQDFNKKKCKEDWADLNRALQEVEATEGLPSVLRALHKQQLDIGFIQDDLLAVIRWRLRHPERAEAAFIVQFNPVVHNGKEAPAVKHHRQEFDP